MEAVKRKRQASEADLQGGDTESSLSPKTKKSPSAPVLENSRDIVVILDAGAQYGKVESWPQDSKEFYYFAFVKINYHNCTLRL